MCCEKVCDDRPSPSPERKKLTPAAERALAEAEARRKAAEASATPRRRNFRVRRVRNRRDMAIGSAKASPRIFESKKVPCRPRPTPTQPLVGNMSPYERINTYHGRRARHWPLAVGPPVFGGLAVDVCSRRGGGDDAAGAALGAAALIPRFDRTCGDDLATRRKSRRAAPRRCPQDHRRRHVRGAGSSVARSRSDDAGSPARHRRAGTESGLCRRNCRWPRRRPARLRDLLAEGEVRIYNIGPDKYQGRVVADAATKRTDNVSAAMRRGRSRAQLQRRPSWRLVRDRRSLSHQNEKAAHAARLSNSNPVRAAQCVTVTVVPMETR